jgi:hypothetical protein
LAPTPLSSQIPTRIGVGTDFAKHRTEENIKMQAKLGCKLTEKFFGLG